MFYYQNTTYRDESCIHRAGPRAPRPPPAGAWRGQGILKRAIVALKWAIRALLGAARSLKLAFGNLKLLLGTLKSALGTIKITLGTIKRGLETLTMVRWILKGAQETRK